MKNNVKTLALSSPTRGLRSTNPQTLSPPAGQNSAGGGQCGSNNEHRLMKTEACTH